MWRSLVARLNGVQEAGSSNLLTQTTQEHSVNCCAPCFVGGEKKMTTRDAHVRSLNFSPARSAADASLRSVCLPAFLLAPTPFSRPFAIPSLRSLQIFSPRPKRRGLNSSATLSSENSFESIAHSFRRSALFRCAEMRAVHSLLVFCSTTKLSRCAVIFSRGTACEHDKTASNHGAVLMGFDRKVAAYRSSSMAPAFA